MDNNYNLTKERVIELFITAYSTNFNYNVNSNSLNFLFVNSEDRKRLIEFIKLNFSWASNIDELIGLVNKDEIQCDKDKNPIPTVEIKNMDNFFELLKTFMEDYVRIKSKFENRNPNYKEYKSVIENIFLRLKSEDINDIEKFLRKQIEMLDYDGLEVFSIKQNVGILKFLNESNLNIQVRNSNYYNESSLEIAFEIEYNNEKVELPITRFGIFMRNGEKICSIGSIQNISSKYIEIVETNKNKINTGIKCNRDIEPKKIISLLLLVLMMNKLGIKKFEFQGYNILDYDYHINLGKKYHENFQTMYPGFIAPKLEENMSDKEYEEDLINYENMLKVHNNFYQKEDAIIKSKTEDLFKLANRLLSHLKGKILYYPFDVDSNLLLQIDDINVEKMPNEATKELYSIINNLFTKVNFTVEDAYDEKSGIFNIEMLNALAIRGDKDSNLILGLLYCYGLNGLEQNNNKAADYFKLGQMLGDIRAQINLSREENKERISTIKRILKFEFKTKLEEEITKSSVIRSLYEFEELSFEELEKLKLKHSDYLFCLEIIESIIKEKIKEEDFSENIGYGL